jgi:hypothetical protein
VIETDLNPSVFHRNGFQGLQGIHQEIPQDVFQLLASNIYQG